MTALRTAPASPRRGLFDAITRLSEEALAGSHGKRADEVNSGSPTGDKDPGGYEGASTHPSATAPSTDSELQPARDGARATENEADVKEDIPDSVDSTTPIASDSNVQETEDQIQIGTHKSGPGDDPSVENDYKDKLPDPGTTHPAKADIGEKYSQCTFKQAHANTVRLSEEILADLANGFGNLEEIEKRAAAAPKPAAAAQPIPLKQQLAKAAAAVKTGQVAPPTTPPVEAAALPPGLSKEAADALQAGYALAASLQVDKTAMDAGACSTLECAIQDALFDADLVGALYKRALSPADEGAGAEDHDQPADAESGAGAANSGGSDGPPPADPGSDMGGGPPPPSGAPGGDPGAGGGPPGAGPGGGPDMPGGGAMPPDGGASEEQALQELAMALAELGIPIERLAGMTPAAQGTPMSDPTKLAKVAASLEQFRRSGKFQYKSAATAYERQLRDYFKTQIRLTFGW